jgi:acyl carrier protein
MTPAKPTHEIESWIKQWISTETGTPITDIDTDTNFANFGMSSSQGILFSGDLSDWSGLNLDPSLVWDYPTIELLSAYVESVSKNA